MKKETQLTTKQQENVNAFERLIGRNVYRRRMMMGLSQEQLALCAGLDPKTVNRIERGVGFASIGSMIKLAEALDCTPSDLYSNPRKTLNNKKVLDFIDEARNIIIEGEYESNTELLYTINQLLLEFMGADMPTEGKHKGKRK